MSDVKSTTKAQRGYRARLAAKGLVSREIWLPVSIWDDLQSIPVDDRYRVVEAGLKAIKEKARTKRA